MIGLNCLWVVSEWCTSLFWVPLNSQILGQALREWCTHGPAWAVLQGAHRKQRGCLCGRLSVYLSRLTLLTLLVMASGRAHLVDPYSSAQGAHAPKVGHAAPAVVKGHVAAKTDTMSWALFWKALCWRWIALGWQQTAKQCCHSIDYLMIIWWS